MVISTPATLHNLITNYVPTKLQGYSHMAQPNQRQWQLERNLDRARSIGEPISENSKEQKLQIFASSQENQTASQD